MGNMRIRSTQVTMGKRDNVASNAEWLESQYLAVSDIEIGSEVFQDYINGPKRDIRG